MEILIAVVTCHKFRSRADAQRNMLVKDMHCWKKGMKVAYCVGVNVDTMPLSPAWSPELSWIRCRNAKSVPAS